MMNKFSQIINLKNIMTKTIQKGFTLIELLVVIAIIGILAGILFVAINPAEQTAKAKDATVKTAMAGIPTAAALDNAESFEDACTAASKEIAKATADAASVSQTCQASTNAFVFAVNLNSGGIYCVDAQGAGIATGVVTTAGSEACTR